MEIRSVEEAAVLADELEGQGDPRAALVRGQLEGRLDTDLVAAHWRDWVGSLDRKATLLRWRWGQASEVGIRAAPAGWTVEELVQRPAAADVQRLALGERVPSRGVERAASLRHLLCFGPLEATELPVAEALTIKLAAPGVDRLNALRAPRLTTLSTSAEAGADEARLLSGVGSAPFFSQLTRWDHRLASSDSVGALLRNQPLLARGGAGLMILCDDTVRAALPAELARRLPRAKVVPLAAPTRPLDPEDFRRLTTHVVPVYAPTDFRQRAPKETSSERGMQSDEPVVTCVGAGFSLDGSFSSCGWCGGADTVGIFTRSSSLYSHFETTSYRTWEYECLDCGLFSVFDESYSR